MGHEDVLRMFSVLYGREISTPRLSLGATVSVLHEHCHGHPRNATIAADRLIVGGDFNLDARDVPPVLSIGRNTRQLVRVAHASTGRAACLHPEAAHVLRRRRRRRRRPLLPRLLPRVRRVPRCW